MRIKITKEELREVVAAARRKNEHKEVVVPEAIKAAGHVPKGIKDLNDVLMRLAQKYGYVVQTAAINYGSREFLALSTDEPAMVVAHILAGWCKGDEHCTAMSDVLLAWGYLEEAEQDGVKGSQPSAKGLTLMAQLPLLADQPGKAIPAAAANDPSG